MWLVTVNYTNVRRGSDLNILLELLEKASLTQKCVFAWMFDQHCAEFDTRRWFSFSSSEGGKFLCAHLKSQMKTYKQDL